MGKLRELYNCAYKPFFSVKVENQTQKKHLVWSIYGTNLDIGIWKRNHVRLHRWFKYFFIVPIVTIGGWVLGKKIRDKPGEGWEDKNIRIFDKAWNNSILEWYDYFVLNLEREKPHKIPRNQVKKQLKGNYSIKTLNTMKRFLFSMVLGDTAYRELLNILMFNITKEMNLGYKSVRKNHLFYSPYKSKSINDINYYIVGGMLSGKLRVHKVKQYGNSR